MEFPEEQGFPYNRTDERCQSILIISLWLIGSVLIDFFWNIISRTACHISSNFVYLFNTKID